jgi:hypothetical protein
MKTSELTGATLDWAVTRIEQPEACAYGVADWREQRTRTVKNGEYLYRWHQSWAQGGPIIEREKITVGCGDDTLILWDAYKREFLFEKDGRDAYMTGPTPLIAAMRCYVASKLGDDVNIPDELK